ncbi:MAG: chemotaxis protein CheR [Pseudomonadota bacterium]|nr:chemotaxis protein CheR [Pseudomonadota bacterium]
MNDAVGAGEREFDFRPADFERIRGLLHQNIGISLSAVKTELVYSRVSRRLRVTGHANFASYLEALAVGSAEWEQFVNALTTNLTSFFREPHHFVRLAQLLPSLPRPVTIWCTASSTGEEPYSLAITAAEAFDSLSPPVRILASDVDTNVLGTARAGVYELEAAQAMGRQRLERFFLRGKGRQQGRVRVRSELQRLVEFRQINLLDPDWQIKAPLAAIFCRNVMIYFDRDTQHRLLSRFVPLLHPEGRLFLGHSETIRAGSLPFDNEGQTIFALARAAGRAA